MKKIILSSFLIAFAILVSCKTKKDPIEPAKTAKELILGDWKLTNVELLGINALDECDREDVISFKSDGAYNYNEGPKSEECKEENYSGKYTLSDDGKTLTIDAIETYSIHTLTQADLVYSTNSIFGEIKMSYKKN